VSDPLFLEMVVWRKTESKMAIRYNCLQRLDSLQYGVHTADVFASMDAAGNADGGLALFLDLFLDVSPVERCQWFDTLDQAIQAHDALFNCN